MLFIYAGELWTLAKRSAMQFLSPYFVYAVSHHFCYIYFRKFAIHFNFCY